jgi:RNA polymerase sigma-70 factor (ECF subfamily)
MSSDAMLVQRLLSGNREAGDALFTRHAPLLRRVLARRLGAGFGTQDTDNVLQQAWLNLLEEDSRRLRRYDPSRPLAPFLIGVVLNACRDYRKAERLRKPGSPLPDLAQPAPSAATEEVREGLQALEPRDRLLLDLVELQGMSYREVARILGVAEGSVGSLTTRARTRLREILGKRESLS